MDNIAKEIVKTKGNLDLKKTKETFDLLHDQKYIENKYHFIWNTGPLCKKAYQKSFRHQHQQSGLGIAAKSKN